MPRIKRKHARQRRGWSDDHRRQLETGWSMFSGSDDWGCPTEMPRHKRDLWPDAETLAEMHEAWAELGGEIMEEYEHSLARPWFWWISEQGMSPDEAFAMRDDAEKYRLDELGLLTAKALAAAAANPNVTRGIYNEAHEPVFRRSWGWWRFTSPERRDESKPEAVLLADIDRRGGDVLTSRERHIVRHHCEMEVWTRGCRASTRLTRAECDALGLREEFLLPGE